MARRVINLFAKRMQIEEAFRDRKSHRFSLAFEDMRTKDPKRLGVLTLVAALAHLALWLTGKVAKRLKAQYDYQATTERGRAVLSTVFLGAQVWRRGDIPIRSPAVADSIAELQALVAQGAKG